MMLIKDYECLLKYCWDKLKSLEKLEKGLRTYIRREHFFRNLQIFLMVDHILTQPIKSERDTVAGNFPL